jgi:putative glycosyltransferase (TIGR04372 family)
MWMWLRRMLYGLLFRLLYVLLRLARVRFINLSHPDRIGHLCIEPDCFIKEGKLGLRPRFRGVLLVPIDKAANKALVGFWKGQLPTVTSGSYCRLLQRFAVLPHMSYSVTSYAVAINETATGAKVYAAWADRPPLLALDEQTRQKGLAALRRLGVPNGAWFVCVHSREGGYSPADEHFHSHRNSDILTYSEAMREIVERGGWCIRVGEPSSQPLPPMTRVVDYAHSEEKSDWMDVFLCASCYFFLGNSSGLYLVATIFGRPSALANLIPVSSALPFGFGDIGIPKLIRRSDGSLISFSEILSSGMGNFRFPSDYNSAGLTVESNSAEDIRGLAGEMLDRLSGTLRYTPADEMQQAQFRSMLAPGHYSYGAASRIGRDFLRANAALLSAAT